MSNIADFFSDVDILGALFALLIVAFFFYLWRLGKSEDNNLQLVDFITGPQGHGDKYSLAYMLALLVSTWAMWYLTVADRLTEWFFSAYLGAFVLGAAFKTGAQVYAAGKQVDAAAQIPGTIEATTTPDSTKTEVTPMAKPATTKRKR